MLKTITKTQQKTELAKLEKTLLSLDSPEFETFIEEIMQKHQARKKRQQEIDEWSKTLPVMKLTKQQEKELEEAINSGTVGPFNNVDDLMDYLNS
jgi:hypothetical protein